MKKVSVYILSFVMLALPLSSMVASTNAATATSLNVSPKQKPLIPDKDPVTGIDMTLSPVYIDITTNPGLPASSEFKITNNNNQKEFYKISLVKFKADATGSTISPMDLDKSDEFAHWISFSDNEFSLESNETKTIKFTIAPPKDAALGYYYGVQVGRIKDKKAGTRQTVVSGSVTLPILMEVRSPNAKKELSIVDFSTTNAMYEYLPAEFKVKIKNSGNVHVVPFGDIFIDQGSKKEIAQIQVNEMRGNILPESERVMSTIWNNGFPVRVAKKKVDGSVETDKNGKVMYETKWNFSKLPNFRIGKYTANLVLVYNDGSRDVPIEAAVSFWVFPWKIILAGFLTAILLLLGIKSVITSIIKK